MSLPQGFDPKWKDIPGYINGITHDIWEDRNIHGLQEFYAPDLIVRSLVSVVQGNTGIIAATQSTLAEFPDRKLLGEDVIWADTGDESFLSSHRLLCTATHTGPGMYGAPTERKLRYRILADCWCKANAVHDEWLVRDQAAIVDQMGHDIWDWTRDLIAREGGADQCVRPFTPANDVTGPYQSSGNKHPLGLRGADILVNIFDGGTGILQSSHDRAALGHFPKHETDHGIGFAEQFWLPLRTSFPNAKFKVTHKIGMSGDMLPHRAALRWTLHGAHDGQGRFGKPTGAEVFIMGITHFEFGPRGVIKEWTLIDDTAVIKQILLQTES
ncbi:MAG: ester cyclase [Planktomarina sp.]